MAETVRDMDNTTKYHSTGKQCKLIECRAAHYDFPPLENSKTQRTKEEYLKELEQAFETFSKDGYLDLVLSLQRLRMLIDHRRIRVIDLAQSLRCTRSWVYLLLRGAAFEPRQKDAWDQWFEKIEDAVTQMTDDRGGVPSACCSQEAYDDLTEYLSHGVYLDLD